MVRFACSTSAVCRSSNACAAELVVKAATWSNSPLQPPHINPRPMPHKEKAPPKRGRLFSSTQQLVRIGASVAREPLVQRVRRFQRDKIRDDVLPRQSERSRSGHWVNLVK